MSREEAIERIQKLIGRFKSDSRTYKALEMAIQALSQEPKTQMVDKSNFDIEQYKMDLQGAYDCGFEAGKKAEQEPCDDAISRKEALNCINDTWGDYFILNELFERISKLPSVMQKSGKWIVHQKPHDIRYLECSCCNVWFLNDHLVRNSYCPNCGAKMESEDKE